MARQATTRTAANKASQAEGFQPGTVVVYPSRGLFTVKAIRPVTVDQDSISALILSGDDGRSSLAVPVVKAEQGALRPLAPHAVFQQALAILCERRRQSRAVWARRAQDYEAKIKTGDPILLAAVLRDLHRSGEQSYGERQILDRALERLTAEYAAVMRIGREVAQARIMEKLECRAAER